MSKLIVPPFTKGFSKIDTKGDRIHYRHAVPDDADELAKLYDRVYRGGYPLKDCLDPEVIRRILFGNEHIWMVALDGKKLIGATVSRPEQWNRSYETCRSVTDSSEKYQGKGIGTTLYDMALHGALARTDCDMTFGYPRTLPMKHLMEKPNPPITVVGTDFGMHLVSGEREIHLFSVIYNPFRTVQRVVDPDPILERFNDLGDLVNRFDFVTETGEYPKRSVVGPSGEHSFNCDHGKLTYNYFAPSRCAQITSLDANDDDGVRTIWKFVQTATSNGLKLDHLSFYLLADKKGILTNLLQPFQGVYNQRFYISAYIPAWYPENGKRYDCLNLATRLTPEEPKMYDTEEIVGYFHTMYYTRRPVVTLPVSNQS